MTKAQLIKEICKLLGKDAKPSYLKTRTIEQLTATYSRWKSVNSLTDKEIARHCDVSFIK